MNRRGSSQRILQNYEQNQPPTQIWGVNQELNPAFATVGNNGRERNCDLSKLVVDCGASTVKLGFSSPSLLNPSAIFQNLVAKGNKSGKFVGGEIEECKNYSALKINRPMDKGYLINWELELQILNLRKTYENYGRHYDASNIDFLLTEPLFNLEGLRRNMYETLFEQEGFRSLFNCCPQMLSLYDFQTNREAEFSNYPAGIVVDCGYSFTHIVPFWDFTKLTYAIKRINVGGKVLTNHLRDIVSHRHWNVQDETYLINIVKERLCYVSLDYNKDSNLTKFKSKKNTISRQYVLPDNISSSIGYVKGVDTEPEMPMGMARPEEQILVMNNERLIPEILFHPSDIGLNQAGIAETIVQSVQEIAPDLHELFYGNIVLMGGSTLLPGFEDRLYQELRPLVPTEFEIKIHSVKDPVGSAWRGGSKFMQQPNFHNYAVTREEYLEGEFILCKRRFDSL
jgi:actin-related protein 6